ncbi:MAG: HNH endonuclease [Aliarcobacter sp.]|nr:HNH endonuclease [Aliarcobacter sp.]
MGKSFIHVHHLKSLTEIKKEYKINPIEDLRPVCLNCHAMIHKKNSAYSIDELKKVKFYEYYTPKKTNNFYKS